MTGSVVLRSTLRSTLVTKVLLRETLEHSKILAFFKNHLREPNDLISWTAQLGTRGVALDYFSA